MRKAATIRARRRITAQQLALLQIQREISAADPHGRLKYVRDFTEAFRDYQVALAPSELAKQLHAADILLVGDYHALAASQAYAASLMERLAQAGRPVVLALEMIFTRDQRILEEWFARKIELEELRRRIDHDSEWGYDWEPWAELLQQARR